MTDSLTPDDLADIEARAEAATEGPWEYGNTGEPLDLAARIEWVADTLGYDDEKRHLWSAWIETQPGRVTIPALTGDGPNAHANAEFIAKARTDVPRLVRALREAWGREDAQVAACEHMNARRKEAEAERDRLRTQVEAVRALADRTDLACVKFIASDGYPSVRVRNSDELAEMIRAALDAQQPAQEPTP
jgi:hypothetical protein